MATSVNPSFSLDDRDGWAGFLAERGYAVVRAALPPAQTQRAMDELWGLMESLGSVRRSVRSSWKASANWPPMLHGGMIQYLGHTPLQWRLREACAPVFARYYDVPASDLATSFDGLCFMHGDRSYRSVGDLVSFLHTDQSPRRIGEWSIQGLINLADGGPQSGGLVVVPGSHLEHQAFFADHPAGDQASDWYQFTAEEKARLASRAVKVCAEPGDFVLWDSRTFHCNTVPARRGDIRACVYVCMLPKDRVPMHIRAKRQQAWRDRRVSCHHPGDGFRTFPTLPRFVTGSVFHTRDAFLGRVMALQGEFPMTPLQRSLLCGLPEPQRSLLDDEKLGGPAATA